VIRLTTNSEGLPRFEIAHSGVVVYLDNWAVIDLAKGDESRRARFVSALGRCGSLLFSFTNAVELAGPQGESVEAVKSFLDSLGPRWLPAELNPWTVTDRELEGKFEPTPSVSLYFMEAYFKERLAELQTGNTIVDVSAANFTQLGRVVDWVQAKRAEILKTGDNIDGYLVTLVEGLRSKYDQDPKALDALAPAVPYDPKHPATFVLNHLLRRLVVDANSHALKKGDGRDFCHVVVGVGYATFAAIDKHWKHRVSGALPSPHQTARLYYSPELDQLVADLELSCPESDSGL
jgi:hypothetical protein